MAKIPQGILGGIRGRVGNVVGAAWMGINYIRSMPLSVANPNTAAQQAQRGAFTQCVLVARLLLADLIANYWDPFARAMSGYNHFISINIDAFVTAGLNTPADFFASRGILTAFDTLAVTASEAAGTVVATYVDNSGTGDALATDLTAMVIYNSTQDYWLFPAMAGGNTRDATPSTATDGDILENDVLDTWTFLLRPDISRISDSEYKEVTVAA